MLAIAPRILAILAFATLTSAAHAQAPMPQPQTQGAIGYLNGGAGDEEVQYLKSSMKDYSLALAFVRAGGEYVASVAVTVKDSHGATVFEAPSAGPYLLIRLPPGRYDVVATYHTQSKSRPVNVGRSASSITTFRWQ